jgi:hypothetical protein
MAEGGMSQWYGRRRVALACIAAVLFGVMTLFAGSRVLMGSDPGYVVYRPLLLFNTLMGAAYVGVGVVAWWHPRLGSHGAALLLGLNSLVLMAIGSVYTASGPVAGTSVLAMSFRTLVWLVLLLVFRWAARRGATPI